RAPRNGSPAAPSATPMTYARTIPPASVAPQPGGYPPIPAPWPHTGRDGRHGAVTPPCRCALHTPVISHRASVQSETPTARRPGRREDRARGTTRSRRRESGIRAQKDPARFQPFAGIAPDNGGGGRI